MLSFILFVALLFGGGFAFNTIGGLRARLALLERIVDQVVAEVQRQRDLLGGRPAPVAEPAPPEPSTYRYSYRQPDVSVVPAAAEAPPIAVPAPIVEAVVETPVEPVRIAPEPILEAALVEPVAPTPTPPPPPSPPPSPLPLPPERAEARPRLGFEEIFGSKLPIWAGGITLAIAGVFIVKYSIDTGLLSPPVRVVLALIFGAALVAAGEFTRTWRQTAADPRVSQALAGAGVAVGYSAILVAANLYHLIDASVAFGALAAITAGALGLALRFGPPCAVLGLVGGLAAPALVGAPPGNVGVLSIYLLLTIAALSGLARSQRWRWLAAAALTGGFGWGAVMLVASVLTGDDSLIIGVYLLLLAFVAPLIAGDWARGPLKLLPPFVAALQMGVLVAQGGYAPLVWGQYALLSAAVTFLAWRDPAQRMLPPLAAAVGAVVVLLWAVPPFALLGVVLIVGALIFAVPAALRVANGDDLDAGQFAGTLVATLALGWFKLRGVDDRSWAAIAVAFASLCAAVAWTRWQAQRRANDQVFATVAGTVATFLIAASVLAVAPLWLPVALVGVAIASAVAGHATTNDRLTQLARTVLTGSFFALAVAPAAGHEFQRLVGVGVPLIQSAFRWAMLALGTVSIALLERDRPAALSLSVVAALAGVASLAQVVPADWLALAYALAAIALARLPRYRALALPAAVTFGLAAGAWMLVPLGRILIGVLLACGGEPLLVTMLPTPIEALLRLIAPAGVLIVAALRATDLPQRRLVLWGAGTVIVAGVFVLAKQVFHIADLDAFLARGMTERVLMTIALYALGWTAWQRAGWRSVGIALTGLALARTIGFDLFVYSPLIRAQQVGPLPLANLLAPAYLLPIVWVELAARREPVWAARATLPLEGLKIVLVLAYAIAALKQAFHGTILTAFDVSPPEDIARSLVAILLALGFLGYGIRARSRIWRVASLVLMLGAVGKVFVFDAAGLDGLLRIGSFVALGFSLIGIGWLYSRFVAPVTPEGSSNSPAAVR